MNLVVVSHRRTGKLVAVVENPNFGNMTKDAVALAWAKANGYAKFPADCVAEEILLSQFANIMLAITPTSVGHEIITGQYDD